MSKEAINLIEKQRYLIPCKCNICKKGFSDIMLCQQHINEEHADREKRNIIDNMIWNVEDDTKKYAILQDLEDQRTIILKKINDLNEIEKIDIPVKIKIKNKEYELKSFVNSITEKDKDKRPSDDAISAYQKDLIKQFKRFLSTIKSVTMGKEVENRLKKKKTEIDSLSDEIDTFLSVKKVIDIIENQK